jgi:hypothetical protein
MNLLKLIPLVSFCLFGLKALILGATWPMAAILAVTASVYLVTEYLENKSKLQKFEDKLTEFEAQGKVFEDKLGKFSDSLGSLQISRGFKSLIQK